MSERPGRQRHRLKPQGGVDEEAKEKRGQNGRQGITNVAPSIVPKKQEMKRRSVNGVKRASRTTLKKGEIAHLSGCFAFTVSDR